MREAEVVQQPLRQKLFLMREAGVVQQPLRQKLFLMREAGGWYQSVCLVPPISELDFFNRFSLCKDRKRFGM